MAVMTAEDVAPRTLLKHPEAVTGFGLSVVVRSAGGEITTGYALNSFDTAALRDRYAADLSVITGWSIEAEWE